MMGTHDMETYKYFKDRRNYTQDNNKVRLGLQELHTRHQGLPKTERTIHRTTKHFMVV